MNAHCIDFERLPYHISGIVTANDLQKTRYSLYPGHTDIFLITGGEKKVTFKESLKSHRKTFQNSM